MLTTDVIALDSILLLLFLGYFDRKVGDAVVGRWLPMREGSVDTPIVESAGLIILPRARCLSGE